jgi:hypothetical protein
LSIVGWVSGFLDNLVDPKDCDEGSLFSLPNVRPSVVEIMFVGIIEISTCHEAAIEMNIKMKYVNDEMKLINAMK